MMHEVNKIFQNQLCLVVKGRGDCDDYYVFLLNRLNFYFSKINNKPILENKSI